MVMASQMLGLAFFKAGRVPQCYSLFGGERRGAPVVSFLRVDRERILLKCDIRHPHELICFDRGLLNPEEIRATLRPGGQILVHASDLPDDLLQALQGFRCARLDAGAISRRLGLGHVINTTILGAYCRVNPTLSIEHVIEAIREMVPAKKDMNEEAARLGYEGVSVCLA